ncbi:MAG: ornithine carbamoyltransferase [Burkholderiales bacterium]|nr:ornithine carbamoyltransferase [Burkholderiales bacterium]
MAIKHFLQFSDFTLAEFDYVMQRARIIKQRFKAYQTYHPLLDRTLVMVFEKNSTRTRLSFEAGMHQLGGAAIYLNTRDSQLGRGEPVEAWIGDANNMLYSWLQAAQVFGFHLHVSTPKGYDMDMNLVSADASHYTVFQNPSDACAGVDLVNTDVWTSMGYEAENQARLAAFDGWIVDEAKMARAHPDALFMHCLPAHRGEEVSAGVIDGPQSVVWDEAENRLHVQKALLEYLVVGEIR